MKRSTTLQKETIANYLKKGYELVENGFDADGQPNFDRDADNTNEDGVQEFIVRLAPKIVEFSATQPIQAGPGCFQETARVVSIQLL